MSRTTITVKYTCGYEKANKIITRKMIDNGYNIEEYKNEKVWKSGNGLWTAMKFIKVEFDTDAVILSGWICSGIGNATGTEMDLSGFVGGLPKKQVIKVLNEIQNALKSEK